MRVFETNEGILIGSESRTLLKGKSFKLWLFVVTKVATKAQLWLPASGTNAIMGSKRMERAFTL